jgi:hypothetical protein
VTGRSVPRATVLAWLPLAVAVTALSLLTYVGVQQAHRMMANDPQIEMAEDAATALEAGATPESIVGSRVVDVARTVAPYLVVYDADKEPVAWSGELDDRPAQPPAGVLDAARSSGENRVTWQPRPGVRQAVVVVPYGGGLVMAGRSLRETERRIADLGSLALAAWAGAMAATLLACALRMRLTDHGKG